MKIKYLIVLSILITMISCNTTYYYQYETYLKNSSEQKLEFEDEQFKFNFLPRPDGIIFLIINKTDKPAYLIWDKSYFIEPSGNSVKALNTDLLDSSLKVAIKENQESILPQQAKFCRFTTAITNYQNIRYDQVNSLTSTYQKNNLSLTNVSGTVTTYDYNISLNYWPVSRSTTVDFVDGNNSEGKELINYIKNNDNMGLGLLIKHDTKIYDYRFDFKFKRVNVLSVKLFGIFDSSKKPTYYAEKENWEWIKIEK